MIASAVWNRFLPSGMVAALFVAGMPSMATPKVVQESKEPLPVLGRAAAPVPGDPDRYYARRVLRRSVPIDSAKVESGWEPVVAPAAEGGHRPVWMHWDDQALYLAVGARMSEGVEVQLDLEADGFDKGAKNLRLSIGASSESLDVQRWERANGSGPGTWTAVPAVEGASTVSRNETLCVVVLRKASSWDLPLREGAAVGLRVRTDGSTSPTAEPVSEPMMRCEFSDEIPAAGAGLTVRISPKRREIVPGGKARLVLEIANVGQNSTSVKSVRIAGNGSDASHVTAAVLPGELIQPGQRMRKEIDLPVADSAGIASLGVSALATLDDGRGLEALTTVDRIEPYTVELQVPPGSVPTNGAERDRTRIVMVVVRGRADLRSEGVVNLTVPPGWTVDGTAQRGIQMSYATEVKGAPYKIKVPPGTLPGAYPVVATVSIAGRKYEVRAQIAVVVNG